MTNFSAKAAFLTNDSPLNSGSVVGLAEPRELEVRVDRVRVKRLTIGGEQTAKARATGSQVDPHLEKGDDLEVRFPAKAGTRVVGVAFVNEIWETEAESEVVVRPSSIAQLNNFWRFQDGDSSVESITVGGPYNPKGSGDTASRRKIFVCRPAGGRNEEPCARKIVSALARQAYRRPVTDEDSQPLLGLYRAARRNGNFEAGIGSALQGILVSPAFLFRIERDPAPPGGMARDAAYPVNGRELASRLSFFLWGEAGMGMRRVLS